MSNAKPTMETYIEMSPRVFEENLTRADALVGGLVERYARRGLRDLRFVASGSSYNSCVAARPFAVCPESRYESILRKCDLPEPKKPEIHTPILSVGASSARS